jgi:hypothetical protein
VTLTFSYSEAEAAATAPDSRRIATQTPQGQWRVPAAVHDAAGRTVTVTTSHFSDWSPTSGEQLIPSSAVVVVGGEQMFHARSCYWTDGPEDPEPDGFLHECRGDVGRFRQPTWSVNGVPGGNGTVGTVQFNPTAGFYKAPRAVPSANPVAVSAQYGDAAVMTMVANVTVVDAVREYRGRISTHTTSPQGDMRLNAEVRFTLVDKSSDSLTYTGTGRAYAHARLTGCSAAQGGADMQPATAMVLDVSESAMITITLASAPHLSFTCGDAPIKGPFMMTPFVGPTPSCPTPQITTGLSELRGAWSCSMAGMRTSANWTLRASR